MASRKQSAAPRGQQTQPNIDPSPLEKAEAAARRNSTTRDELNLEAILSGGAQIRGEGDRLRHIADLLGGPKVVGKYPADPLAAHEMLERGLPNTAIKCLLDGMTTLGQKSIESAIGMSVRTRQRREKHPAELLSQDQTGRTWKLAEILTRATSAFGSRSAAEQWLAQPATGLDQRRPIDLLTTPAGVELVEDFLGRIEYGVYT
jgi:putative toxin-antitoxin system antitoxin component (TIGR02293 family)